MEGIKEALAYAVQLAKPEMFTVGDETFCTQNLHRIEEKKDLIVEPLRVATLTGFIDYILNNRDKIDLAQAFIVIEGTRTVTLKSVPNKDKNRETFIEAKAIVPEIRWGAWQDNEEFVIGLQSKFDLSEHRDILMKYIGNLQEEEAVQTMDDGVSQRIVAKTGVANFDKVILPNPVKLRPFRTFQEVVQIESPFIFRVRKGGDCALFEADGGEWAIRCRASIKAYLQEALADIENIVIIG